MPLQGSVAADHVPVNNYTLTVTGLKPIFFTEISGIELEIQSVDLPDRTKATGGQFGAQEFTAKTMIHHTVERAELEAWLDEAKDKVKSTYKKTGTLTHKTLSGASAGVYALSGLWVMKRKLPDLSAEDEGAPAQIEWTFSVDKTVKQS
jgi:hypothetical protein